MADNKIRLPSSQGGIVKYDSEYESDVILKPEIIVGICVAVIVGLIILRIVF